MEIMSCLIDCQSIDFVQHPLSSNPNFKGFKLIKLNAGIACFLRLNNHFIFLKLNVRRFIIMTKLVAQILSIGTSYGIICTFSKFVCFVL